MSSEVVFGNAGAEGASRGGWFAGHFMTPEDDPRSTSVLEVKWGVHPAGDCRTQWAVNGQATTLSILVKGRFRLQFPSREICCLAKEIMLCDGRECLIIGSPRRIRLL